jgi:hypothetical protein
MEDSLMRLQEFEGQFLRLHLPSNAGIVKAEKVYWLGGRVVSVWYHQGGKRGTGRIYLPWGAGKDLKLVKEELKIFIKEEKTK